MEQQRAPMGKTLPHSRSISLQMLTRTPNTAPLKQEMYTEALQPMRSPPLYSRDSSYLAPPLASYTSTIESPVTRNDNTMGQQTDTLQHTPQENSTSARQFHGDAAFASSFSRSIPRDRSTRAVSMPAKSTSAYDSMFTFSSALPEDLSQTLFVPTGSSTQSSQISTPAQSNSPLPHSPSISASSLYRPDGMRQSYISGTRSAQGIRSTSASKTVKERPTGTRRPSMLNSLGSWLEKK